MIGKAWVGLVKLRNIKSKMQDKFKDANACFDLLDKDGGGELSRRELATGKHSNTKTLA